MIHRWLLRALPAAAGVLILFAANAARLPAQTTSGITTEQVLSMVLPPLADGSRPPVHMWARADQANGPGNVPTSFIVTLYTDYSGSSPVERETVNYVQSINGAWTPARPQAPGTMLTDDWAWLSMNLTDLSATAAGEGGQSTYTVDYTASGDYSGSPRTLEVEEVYAADLSLQSTTVLADSAGLLSSTTPTPYPATATPTTAASAASPSTTPAPSATAASTGTATRSPALSTPLPSGAPPLTTAPATPASGPYTIPGAATASATTNTIRSGPVLSAATATASTTPAPVAAAAPVAAPQSGCTGVLSTAGYTWNGSTQSLGSAGGQPATVCLASGPAGSLPATQSFGCLLVGGQAATIDGMAGCVSFLNIQSQGNNTFLVIQKDSALTATVTQIAWSSGGFATKQSYTACLSDPATPVQSASACQASGLAGSGA